MCSSDLIAAMLTSVPGASAAVRGGIVSYVNDVKEKVLGVSGDVLGTQGAVDELVALQMARGALRDMGSDVAVSVTGIAGPAGAEPGKPVGTVWIGCATVRGTHATRYGAPPLHTGPPRLPRAAPAGPGRAPPRPPPAPRPPGPPPPPPPPRSLRRGPRGACAVLA